MTLHQAYQLQKALEEFRRVAYSCCQVEKIRRLDKAASLLLDATEPLDLDVRRSEMQAPKIQVTP